MAKASEETALSLNTAQGRRPANNSSAKYTNKGRFLSTQDVADELGVSLAQVLALVRSGELRAIKVGGRGFWRVERVEVERYIETTYASTQEYLRQHGDRQTVEDLHRPGSRQVAIPGGEIPISREERRPTGSRRRGRRRKRRRTVCRRRREAVKRETTAVTA